MLQRHSHTAHKGFSLVELLLAMAILASIMVMITPLVFNRLGTRKLQTQAIQTIGEISKAHGMAVRENGMIIAGSTNALSVMRFINYVKTVKTGNIQVLTGLVESDFDPSPCSDAHPCLLLQNGGYLQYGQNAIFPTKASSSEISAIVLNYDPDGPGIQVATTLLLYENGRITSAPWAAVANTAVDTTIVGTVPNSPLSAPLANQFSDPEYFWAFSYETAPTN